MPAVTTLLPQSQTAPQDGSGAADPAPAGFAAVLADAALPVADDATGRQALAGGGKFLPGEDAGESDDDTAGAPGDDAGDAPTLDPRMIDPAQLLAFWPAAARDLPPRGKAAASGDAALAVQPHRGGAAAGQDTAAEAAGADDAAVAALVAQAPPAPGAKGASTLVDVARPDVADGAPATKMPLAIGNVRPAASSDGQSAPAPAQHAPDPVVDRVARPAAQVFADRIAGADAAPARPARRGAAIDSAAPALAGASAAATDMTARPVAAMAGADQNRLETRDPAWIDKLVDRIETMRDDMGARETRIRLSPDALGTLEVKLSDRDGRVHVEIDADQAATRQMLADAAPRLADLAHARGLRLSTGFGDGQGQQRRDGAQDQSRSARGPAFMTDTGTRGDDALDDRIA